MKISFVTKFRLPQERGVSYGVVVMCQALSDIGCDVELLCPKRIQTDAMRGKNIWDYHQIKRDCFRFIQFPCLEIPPVHVIESVVKHIRYQLIYWSYSILVVAYLMFKRRKVVHVFDDAKEVLVLLSIFSWIYKPLLVFEMHLIPVNWYERLLLDSFVNRVDLVICTTGIFATYCLNKGLNKQNIIVFPNCINPSDFNFDQDKLKARSELGISRKKFVVGYGGRFQTDGLEKGIPDLMKALRVLLNKKLEITLVCVGGPDYLVSHYESIAAGLMLSKNNYIIVGHVPPADLRKYMYSFDICAMPFPLKPHFINNMSPLKTFEYMATGNPIIATDLPSIREILRHGVNAYLVQPDNFIDLAKGIEYLYTHKSFSKKIALESKKEVIRKYTWRKRARAEVNMIGLLAAKN